MKLTIKPRVHQRKSDATRLRRAGQIPAIIYHKGQEGEAVSVLESDFAAGLRALPQGRLATTLCKLETESGKVKNALVKDIHYHPVSYKVLHLDFEELKENVTVKVNIPLVVTGMIDSVGVKLGGMVRVVIRHLKVECLPKDIPAFIEVDVTQMNIGDVKKLSDLKVPNTVRPLMNMSNVAISMVKR